MSRSLLPVAILVILSAILIPSTGCKKKVESTAIQIEDSIRTYYPVIQGEELEMQFKITNIGRAPLVITDIQPSCGCISIDQELNNIIPPGDAVNIRFRFHSEKNIGYVHHVVRLFGNILPDGEADCIFNVNVVPLGDYTRDYEELHKEINERRMVEGLVDGNPSEKGYFVDPAEDSRSHERYPWREE